MHFLFILRVGVISHIIGQGGYRLKQESEKLASLTGENDRTSYHQHTFVYYA